MSRFPSISPLNSVILFMISDETILLEIESFFPVALDVDNSSIFTFGSILLYIKLN